MKQKISLIYFKIPYIISLLFTEYICVQDKLEKNLFGKRGTVYQSVISFVHKLVYSYTQFHSDYTMHPRMHTHAYIKSFNNACIRVYKHLHTFSLMQLPTYALTTLIVLLLLLIQKQQSQNTHLPSLLQSARRTAVPRQSPQCVDQSLKQTCSPAQQNQLDEAVLLQNFRYIISSENYTCQNPYNCSRFL